MWGASDRERMELARAYPFAIPDRSFHFRDGAMLAFDRAATERDDRVPVIACGSNRSPEQLARKYAGRTGVDIPVERAWLDDFDTVFVAHITSYGSIAATLQHVPGCRVEVSITWLTPAQLAAMHATESVGRHYHYARLDRLALERESGGTLSSAYAYVTILGCLRHQGGLVGVSEVRAHGRPHRAMTQPRIHEIVRARLAAGEGADAFVLANIHDPKLRRTRERELARDAHPFAWPHLERIEA